MTDLPHVAAGQLGVSEEHQRVVEAWWREHNNGPLPLRWTASMYNQAVDWWNAGATDTGEDDELAEAVAQAWHYPDVEGESE